LTSGNGIMRNIYNQTSHRQNQYPAINSHPLNGLNRYTAAQMSSMANNMANSGVSYSYGSMAMQFPSISVPSSSNLRQVC